MDDQPDDSGSDDIDSVFDSIERNLDRASRSSSQLDRMLISLSAGALVLSMAFVGANAPGRCLLVVLFLSWLFFITTMIMVVFAMRSEQAALIRSVSDSKAALGLLERNPEVTRKAKTVLGDIPVTTKRIHMNRTVILLNNLALSFFISGVVLLGVFVGVSLWDKIGS